MRVKKVVCTTCGSEDVEIDALVTWNVKTQQHEVNAIMNKGHRCNGECQDFCEIETIEVESDLSV